ncbi:hypothetical protein LJC45_00110 [Alistipes sp. OttesenSCG-928-B03]|nr:hypothetical protein [Alistipes sp. OttesenSCG-928-B03]
MKKNNFFAVSAAVALLMTGMVACDDDNNNGTTPPPSETELSGTISDIKKLDANTTYSLAGPVIVEEGGTLDIPAGTVIKAKKGFGSYILVLQGGKIYARGTADKPVKITADTENATAGHWGGLIINGKAPLSGGETGTTEINSAYTYGGNAANDNSGELTYLILEYTGARSSADVEHNGLTLNGVGNGTKIENIYIPEGSDDGIEFFGGTVNVTNLLVVNSDDDMFDFTQGYSGTLKNAYGIWETGFTSSEADPRGIEADGNLDGGNPDQSGQSDFRVENVTFDLRLAYADAPDKTMQDVIKIRRGAKATVANALVKGTGCVTDLVDFGDKKGNGNTASSVGITNSLTTAPAKEINPETGYDNAKVESGNAGCATSAFSWTGYRF